MIGPLRPRASFNTLLASSGPRVSIESLEDGDIEVVCLRVPALLEERQVHDLAAELTPWLMPPRSLWRRRQIVELCKDAARIIAVDLEEWELAMLHRWQGEAEWARQEEGDEPPPMPQWWGAVGVGRGRGW